MSFEHCTEWHDRGLDLDFSLLRPGTRLGRTALQLTENLETVEYTLNAVIYEATGAIGEVDVLKVGELQDAHAHDANRLDVFRRIHSAVKQDLRESSLTTIDANSYDQIVDNTGREMKYIIKLFGISETEEADLGLLIDETCLHYGMSKPGSISRN